MPPIRCPHCDYQIVLQGAKPGRFTPACPGCKHRFSLVIPNEEHAAPVVALVSREQAVTAPPAAHRAVPQATMPPAPASSATMAPPVHVELSAAPLQASSTDSSLDLSGRIGGYEISHKLGQGGMGAVYLARQISLDRNVALKVLSPSLAADPEFVSRFAQEAYAAAQLTHHNVVQIHDIGIEPCNGHDTNFFSMEFVEGQSLSGVLKEAGKIDPEAAAGYILQAARGLKFAHEHGLIHRDVKPDNLLLNDQGVLKVADLGLVKRMNSTENLTGAVRTGRPPVGPNATQFSVSMGTPAYMPPEQFQNAARADERADIYSLGCSFYDLLTGHPPFSGRSAYEVMTKHATEAPVPPERSAKRVPPALSSIVMKMIAKHPSSRYQRMGEVIDELESWLGVESGKPFSPKEEHVALLERAVKPFNENKWAKLRPTLLIVFFVASFLSIIVLALPRVGHPLAAAGMVGFVVAATVFYQAIYNIDRRTFLASKVRQFVFSSRPIDWLRWGLALVACVVLGIAFGVHWVMLVFVIGSLLVAASFYATVDTWLRKAREPLLRQTENMLKDMRLRGLDENALRQFVARYAGVQWEAFYEALFGYEAKLTARDLWGRGDRAKNRPKYAAWREPIIGWIERRMKARQEQRELLVLAKLERKVLAAKGINEKAAAKAAERAAEKIVDQATRRREYAKARMAQTVAPNRSAADARFAPGAASQTLPPGSHPHAPFVESNADDESDVPREHASYYARRFGSPLDYLFGRTVRLVIGGILLLGFALWWNQNSGAEALRQASGMLASREDATVTAKNRHIDSGLQVVRALDAKTENSQQLRLSHAPQWYCETAGSYSGFAAAACSIVSVLFIGRLFGIAAIVSAAVMLLGSHLRVPIIEARPSIAIGLGLVMFVLSVLFLRETRSL